MKTKNKPELQPSGKQKQKVSTGKKILCGIGRVLVSLASIVALFMIGYCLFPLFKKFIIDPRWTTAAVVLMLVLIGLLLIKNKKIGKWFGVISALILYPFLIAYYFLLWSYEPKNLQYDESFFAKPSSMPTTLQTKDNNGWFEIKALFEKYGNKYGNYTMPLKERLFDGLLSVRFVSQHSSSYVDKIAKNELGLVETASLYSKHPKIFVIKDRKGNEIVYTGGLYSLTGEAFAQAWSGVSHNMDIGYAFLSGELQQFAFELNAILDSGKSFQNFYSDSEGNSQNCNPECATLIYTSFGVHHTSAVRTLSSAGMYLISKGEYSQGTAYFATAAKLAKTVLYSKTNDTWQLLMGSNLYRIILNTIDTTVQNFPLPEIYKDQLASIIEQPSEAIDSMFENAILEDYYVTNQYLKNYKNSSMGVSKLEKVLFINPLSFDEDATRAMLKHQLTKQLQGNTGALFQDIFPTSGLTKVLFEKNVLGSEPNNVGQISPKPYSIKNRMGWNLVYAVVPRLGGIYETMQSLEQLRSYVYTELTK